MSKTRKKKKERTNTMGMAASQVRLLALTDRLHDVELKAQQILSQKLALGTQKDALYNDYNNALEATNYKVAFRNDNGTASYFDANYANMCTYNPNRSRNYAFTNASGKILVSQDEADTYNSFSNDKYAFAWAMMNGGEAALTRGSSGPKGSANSLGLNENNVSISGTTYLEGLLPSGGMLTDFEVDLVLRYQNRTKNTQTETAISDYSKKLEEYKKADSSQKTTIKSELDNLATAVRAHYEAINKEMMPQNIKGDGNDLLMTEAEVLAFMNLSTEQQDFLQGCIDAVANATDFKEQQKLYKDFREALYGNLTNINEIAEQSEYMATGQSTDIDFDAGEFNFYVQRWEAINNAGGCEVIDQRYINGEEGREYLENMMQAGLIVVQEYNTNQKKWQDTSIATSTNGNYLIEEADEAELKRAEAKYEHELDIIDRKETKMDNELAKLETERKAITTEMDSLKTVKDDNIDRTFGIFG